jgi:drug/metabolite transporter (DMT)-like permease
MNTSNKPVPSTLKVIIAFAIVYIVWGSTYFFIQKAITGFPALLLGAIRFIIAGILMLGWSMLQKEIIFVKKDVKNAAISGFLMLFIGNGAVIWVEQYLPSAMVAIMVSSAPLWFVILDKPKWNINFRSKATIAGLIIGFAGVILLFYQNIMNAFSGGEHTGELSGLGILIIGSIAWAGGSLFSKYKSHGGSLSANSGWQMLSAGIAFSIGSFFRNEIQTVTWDAIPSGAWFSLVYLIVMGSIAGFSAYVWLLKVRPATQVSTYAYVNPVVAVLLGIFFANENITWLQIAGLVVILASVLLINLNNYWKERSISKPEHIKSDRRETNKSETHNTIMTDAN